MFKKKGISLSESISALIDIRPSIQDPEDGYDLATTDQIASTSAYDELENDELELSKFRKLNIELLDAEDNKYMGKRVARKTTKHEDAFGDDSSEFEVSSEEQPNISDEEDAQSYSEPDHSEKEEDDESDGEMEDDGDDDDNDNAEEDDIDLSKYSKDEENLGLKQISSKSQEEILKGKSVRNQINIWDFLLECRIKFQKCLLSSNRLPQKSRMQEFKEKGGQEFEHLVTESEKNFKKVLSSLLQLQDLLYVSNPEVCSGISGKRQATSEMEEEITSDSETEEKKAVVVKKQKYKKMKLNGLSDTLNERHLRFNKFRNETIQKWNDKTSVAQASSKSFSAFEQSTLKQIEEILVDRSRLIKRTQLKRSSYRILGENEGPSPSKQQKMDVVEAQSSEYNNDIFDDEDFYHQLLRELLERKSRDVTDPVQLGRQWIQLQKLRSKMKRKVDTRASKGRKIKYVVHPKLVNFMMPVSNTAWTDEAKNTLFASLFSQT